MSLASGRPHPWPGPRPGLRMPHRESQPRLVRAGVQVRIRRQGLSRQQQEAEPREQTLMAQAQVGTGHGGLGEGHSQGPVPSVLQWDCVHPVAPHARDSGQQPVVSVGTRAGGLWSGPHTCPPPSLQSPGELSLCKLSSQGAQVEERAVLPGPWGRGIGSQDKHLGTQVPPGTPGVTQTDDGGQRQTAVGQAEAQIPGAF